MVKKFSTVRDTQRGSELHGEEKREEGDRGDLNEMRWDQKRREQTSQYSLPYVCATVWTAQRYSRSYTEKREEEDRGGQEDKGGIKRRETDLASNPFPKCSPQRRTHKEIHRVG